MDLRREKLYPSGSSIYNIYLIIIMMYIKKKNIIYTIILYIYTYMLCKINYPGQQSIYIPYLALSSIHLSLYYNIHILAISFEIWWH